MPANRRSCVGNGRFNWSERERGEGAFLSGLFGAGLSMARCGEMGAAGGSDRDPAFAGYELAAACFIGGATGDDDQGQEKGCDDDQVFHEVSLIAIEFRARL
jgi:hypothetical protein